MPVAKPNMALSTGLPFFPAFLVCDKQHLKLKAEHSSTSFTRSEEM